MVLNTNISAISALRSANKIGALQEKASQRLSSGLKINSAADDSAGLAISEKMRSQIRGLDRASENINDGINFFYTADSYLAEMNSMVIRARELAIQAANDTNTDDERYILNLECSQILNEIDAMSDKAEFNTIPIFRGSSSESNMIIVQEERLVPIYDVIETREIEVDVYETVYTWAFPLESKDNYDTLIKCDTYTNNINNINITNNDIPPQTITVSMFLDRTLEGSYADLKSTVSPPLSSATFNDFLKNDLYLSGAPDYEISPDYAQFFVDVIVDALNEELSGVQVYDGNAMRTPIVQGGVDSSGNLYFKFDSGGWTLSVRGCTPAINNSFGHDFFHMSGDTTQSSIQTGETITEEINVWGIVGYRTEMVNVVKRLDGDRNIYLQVGANALQGETFKWPSVSTELLGINDAKLLSISQAVYSLNLFDVASDSINNIRAEFGAYINRLKSSDSNVTNTSLNISGSESRIRDADMAKEMMNLTKATVLSQASTSMLGLANQAPQTVLKLLQ